MLVIATVMVTLLMLACAGQQDKKLLDDAVALAEQGSQALNDMDMEAYAAIIHPDDLENFRSMLMPDIERLAQLRQTDSITLFDKTFSIEDLRSEPAEKFFVDLMVTIFDISPELKTSFTEMTNDHIGAVAQSDSLIHVVVNTKMQVGTRHVNEMNVSTVRRYEDGWKLRISNKIEGIALMLQQSLRMQQG
ncbi:MAG: hypothetical protein JSU74_07435 [Candidatus Zixiibacteriota bacterium]|nr:MAG: hypothetical protein JSU74_07435 [candidate division Zixibacteria bacterium]